MPKGCGTCRDRKVLCDRTIPVCRRCIASNRPCKGYGVRLSWPTEKDGRRRATLGKSSTRSTQAPSVSSSCIISASNWDFEMSYFLSNLGSKDRTLLLPPLLPTSLSWNPVQLDTRGKDLFHYFENVASYSLSTYGSHAADVRNLILRMALTDNTPLTVAVMQSLLAVSSMHRFGVQSHGTRHKVRAIRALTQSLQTSIDTKQGLQHMAAGMLLCSLESTDTTGQWIVYMCGVKDVIGAAHLAETSSQDNDFLALLSWMYYHDALSSFSIRHWRRFAAIKDAYVQEFGEKLSSSRVITCIKAKLPNGLPASHTILAVLYQACDAALDPLHPEYTSRSYQDCLSSLQNQLINLSIGDAAVDAPTCSSVTAVIDIELFRLATLVYIERMARPFLEYDDRAHSWTERAFSMLSRLDSYERPFPLLIFALEARTESRRQILLDLMAKTEESSLVRNLGFVKAMMFASWVQDDIAEGGISYMDRLNAVFSSKETLPALA